MKKFSLTILFFHRPKHSAGPIHPGLLKGAPQSPEPAATQTDPLGRENPSGTVFGFLQEAPVWQLPGRRRLPANERCPPRFARARARPQAQGADGSRLRGQHAPDQYAPEGNPESGGIDAQTIGAFVSGEADVPWYWSAQPTPTPGKIWLFSSETLSKVPELYDNLQVHQMKRNFRKRW